jgi:uncharacterized protein (DUF1800 family)
VTELARVLTGWTLDEPRDGGGYIFREARHEPGDKVVLGRAFHENGQQEGEAALAMLAAHPSTAHFICTKLAQRFVSDAPPEALVDRMAHTFQSSDGDIRQVLTTMLQSPEFWQRQYFHAKVKTPLEFTVSALRATGADVTKVQPVTDALNRLGMPLYGAQPPTGYSMKAESWVNSGALLNRLNFALALGNGRLGGIKLDAAKLGDAKVDNLKPGATKPGANPVSASDVQSQLELALVPGGVSPQTHQTIAQQRADPAISGRKLDDPPRPVNAGAVAGLILGSPEFQRR